jgi:hypothetical protein
MGLPPDTMKRLRSKDQIMRQQRLTTRSSALRPVCLLTAAAMTAASTASFAYRPFDGTDAAVADVHEVEIELQPAGVLRQDSEHSLIGPFTIFNYGFAKNWEFVFQGQGQFPLNNPDESNSVNGVGAFLKHVVREGSLQDASGPSIAIEFGPLLPGVRADSGFGASFGTIVSQRWDWGTVHANIVTADVVLGGIIEGPAKWKVRPVAEFFYEETIGQTTTVSGLVGAIWQVKDNLSFDVGYRHALVNGHPVDEVRAGVTFGLSPPQIKGRRTT